MAKRKEIEDAVDAIEGFSLPAFKIRRLEPKLPYLIEEVPCPDGGFGGGEVASEMAYTVEDPVVPPPGVAADDKAIVLYRPSDASLDPGPVPSNPSLLISPAMLKNLKNLHQGSNDNLEDKYPAGDDCLAVVPWVPPVPGASTATYWSNHLQNQSPVVIEELMESEESTAMEVEDEPVEPHRTIFGESGGGEGYQQQWRLHCMAPGTQPNATSHLMWSQ